MFIDKWDGVVEDVCALDKGTLEHGKGKVAVLSRVARTGLRGEL